MQYRIVIVTYRGRCFSCHRAIERGDVIYRRDDGQWLCENCATRKEHT